MDAMNKDQRKLEICSGERSICFVFCVLKGTNHSVGDGVSQEVGEDHGSQDDGEPTGGGDGKPPVVHVLVQGLLVDVVIEPGTGHDQNHQAESLK